jgi:hypothetical protein
VSATVVEIADLLTEDLNDSSFQESLPGDRAFTATRTYLPLISTTELDKAMQVFVVPRSMATSNNSRSGTTKLPLVEVGIVSRPPNEVSDDWLDDMVDMVEDFSDRLLRKAYTLSDDSTARCTNTETPFSYDYASLREGNEFRSFILCTFRKEE